MSQKAFDETNAKLDILKQARPDWQLFKDNRNELVNKREQQQTLVPNNIERSNVFFWDVDLGDGVSRRPTWAPAMGKDARMNTKHSYKPLVQKTRSELKVRSKLEGLESRARALKPKKADEGGKSDKTPSLKQITGDEKGKKEEDLRMAP
ncbi:hypothetical protein BY996DRAFT_6490793 [Phakopsora pachyrhizi]|nr:hypothetical protein BY996DRAFT_6490793 [Phakopsora pachyrhizi]